MASQRQEAKYFRYDWANVLERGYQSTAEGTKHYQQGKGKLQPVKGRYCCLGVACDLLKPDGWEKVKGGWSHVFGKDADDENGVDVALNAAGLKATGLNDKEHELLQRMNDHGATFSAIADYLRSL